MKLTFDYYHNLEQVDLYLCNPDGRELFSLSGKNRNFTLRFNDLSELTFEIDSKITLSDNTVVDIEAYDYIQSKRLIFATNIGWFQITKVDEHDTGVAKYKTITAESYQSVLKNKGFIAEERIYCFYNPNDPDDDFYVSTNDESIPSVLGQWKKQLGIKQDLKQGLAEPSAPYDDWTVTYVNESLFYAGADSKCRTFKENTTYGYDWIVNDVEDAFEVVVLFDFMYKTIHVMMPSEVAQKVNVLYTFNNFMKSIDVNETSDDIVTVLNCNGDNCDITAVNPTGTNYICDFSYFMDKVNHRWMSSALIEKLEQWKTDCDAEKDVYTGLVEDIRVLYQAATEKETLLQEMSLSLADLRTAQNKRSVLGSGTAGALCGTVLAENVQIEENSIKEGTNYYSTAFTGDEVITAYQSSPSYNSDAKKWEWSAEADSMTGKADEIVAYNLSDANTSGISYWYFSDDDSGASYCKLKSAATVDKSTATSTYRCGGFDRYIAYTYPIVDESTGNTEYTDTVQSWIDIRESHVNELNIDLCGYARPLNGYQVTSAKDCPNPTNKSIYGRINALQSEISAIANRLNILHYFADTPDLLRELNCYWIEGDYTNDNIAVLDETTPEEEISLSKELLEAGYIELGKICQPRFSFSVESIDATKQYEFKEQMRLLELGKIITIEKEEGVWYYPALLEISINLDNSEEFSMTFANAMRLNDWGYTYADLISDASSTSRKVSANWQNILAYSKEREEISSLIKDPLDTALRASFANAVNQEFIIDKNGILGRKKASESSDKFEDEQVRLINNQIVFTDDNWKTAKAALGKITYREYEADGKTPKVVTSYGLVAETIIGSLIMGEELKISNKDSTIKLDGSGILVSKPIRDEEGRITDYQTTFKAEADTGKLTVHEAEITGDIKGGTINIGNNFLVDNSGNVSIKSGSININDNFKVDESGNVQLNGSVTWGTGNSPTQIVYSNTALVKPANEKKWSEFPESDSSGWHKKYAASDYFASYTYDGGSTWTDAIRIAGINGKDGQNGRDGLNGSDGANGKDGKDGANGADGTTIQVVYLYYRKSDSSVPSKPIYSGDTLPTEWTLEPPDATAECPYVFVSQCTVTNGVYGTWSNPALWAKYGADGTTIQVVSLYYLTDSSDAPAAPSYNGDSDTLGNWTLSPSGVTSDRMYEFVSQCTVTDGTYGDWSAPVLWAKYGKDGDKGDSISVKYLYYSKSDSTPPSKPVLNNGSFGDWKDEPLDATAECPYVFVSQCYVSTITGYGEWSTPTCWAKYGANGSDANVTYINVFNALTNNGKTYGCFTGENGDLYINADYIKTGKIESELTLTGKVVAENIEATGGTIGGWVIGKNKLYYTIYEKNEDGTETKNVINGTGFQPPNIGYWAIAVGYTSDDSWGDAPFRVSHSGELCATKGTIGGWAIGENKLYYTLEVEDENGNKTGEKIGTGFQRPGVGETAIAVGYNSDTDWRQAPFRVSHKGELYATKGKIGNFEITKDGDLHLSTEEKKSNIFVVDSKYEDTIKTGGNSSLSVSIKNAAKISSGTIEVEQTYEGTTNYIKIDCASAGFPQLSFGYGNAGRGITFAQYTTDYMLVKSDNSSNFIIDDCGFGVYNKGYHMGVTGQIAVGGLYIRIDKGIITGVSDSKYGEYGNLPL